MGLLTKFRGGDTRKESVSPPSKINVPFLSTRRRSSSAMNGRFRVSTAPARDFYITLQEAHKIWKPNEIISGEVTLILKDDIANVSIRLSLVGEIRMKAGLGTTSRTKVSEELFEKTTLIYGDEEGKVGNSSAIVNGLTKGEHRFPFRIKLPAKNVFTSVSFERGSISYHVRCQLESFDSSQQDKALAACEKKFSVLVPVDVGLLPKPNTKTVVLQSPSSLKQQRPLGGEQDTSSSLTKQTNGSRSSNNTIGSTSSQKTVTISVDLPSSGFVIGEIIPVKLKLEHYKEYSHPTGLIATLVRICRVCGSSKDEPMETFRKDICQTVGPIYVDPESHECTITVYLKVPLDAFPTLTMPSRHFSFQYYVEVLVNLSRKNLVFTESNRVIGTGSNSDLSVSKLGSTMEETVANLQRKLRSGPHGDPMKNDDRESLIFFKDLINVDKLKRLRNVTGMSIEVVVGTNRSKQIDLEDAESAEGHLQPQSDSESEALMHAQLQPLSHTELRLGTHPPLHSAKELHAYSTTYGLDNDEQYVMPLPQYTPNSLYDTVEDKDELERRRLQELESEPPPDNDGPNY